MYDIEQIKQRNPIEEVISRHGVVLLRKGSRFAGRCPFHDDDYPSLVVYPQTRSFFCFGCGAHGDVIDFVQRIDGLGFRAALERLDGAPKPAAPEPKGSGGLSLGSSPPPAPSTTRSCFERRWLCRIWRVGALACH
jgi:DNA primase